MYHYIIKKTKANITRLVCFSSVNILLYDFAGLIVMSNLIKKY